MKFILTGLFIFLSFNSCKSQDSTGYTRKELVYGKKDGMGMILYKMSPKVRSNGKAIISVVSGNWISSFTYATRLEKSNALYK